MMDWFEFRVDLIVMLSVPSITFTDQDKENNERFAVSLFSYEKSINKFFTNEFENFV